MVSRPAVIFRAIAFVVLVCVILIAADGWRSWNARTVQLQEMDVATSNLSRAMAQQADGTFREADTVLVGLVERVEVDGRSESALQRLHKILSVRKAELTQLNGLFVFGETGEWLASSEPTLSRQFNNADREYFIFHRTHADLGPHIGLPVKSRSSGKWVIPISRRIDKQDGSFGGVALATVDVDFFTAFYNTLQIGDAGAIALILDSGAMLVRRPYSEIYVGKDVKGTELFHLFTTQSQVGTVFIKSAQDGVTRLNSYRRLPHYPIFVAAALSKDEILREWWHDTIWHTAGVLGMVVLVGVFGWRLVKQIELRTTAEAELIKARDSLENLNRTLERLAMQDGLTGLANRRQFDVTLYNEFSRATRQASALALIMMDVDCFKQYNDIYGHAAGDECLRTIGRLIKELAARRPGDLAARYGGEELAVLLPNTDVTGAMVVAEQIRNAIRDLNIEHTGNPAGIVTISAGVDARVPVRGAGEPGELIVAADKALYQAKSGGRNRVLANRES